MHDDERIRPDAGRRTFLGGLALAAAGAAATGATAQTLEPPAPMAGRTNPEGRFASKAVLITGATARRHPRSQRLLHRLTPRPAAAPLGRPASCNAGCGVLGRIASYDQPDMAPWPPASNEGDRDERRT